MPVRFTCRLLLIRTASETFRVEYGHLGSDCTEILQFTGPHVIMPPTQELTEEQLDEWRQTIAEQGFNWFIEGVSENAPLVEAKRTYEDIIPKGSVKAELDIARNNETGQVTLAVRLKNQWRGKIPNVSVTTDHVAESPDMLNLGGITSEAVGGSETMLPMPGNLGKDLLPDRVYGFYLDPRFFEILKTRAVAFSPESHWITLRTDGHEFDRIPGKQVATFLMNVDEPSSGQEDK